MDGMDVVVFTQRDAVLERDIETISFVYRFTHPQAHDIVYNTNFVETLTMIQRIFVNDMFRTAVDVRTLQAENVGVFAAASGSASSTPNRADIMRALGPMRKCRGHFEPSDICSICHDSYKDNEFFRQLPCSHRFHKKCVDRWLFRSPPSSISPPSTSVPPSCPNCRAPVVAAEEEFWPEFDADL